MKQKLLKLLPYAMVAAISAALTLLCALPVAPNNDSKLEELENLILEKFIGEADLNAMEDAAADLGRAASAHANITHDPEQNLRELLEIYRKIAGK